MTQKATTFALLSKRWVTALESAQAGGCLSLSQRCGEWRRGGHCIVDRWVTMASGARVKAYRLVKPTKWTA